MKTTTTATQTNPNSSRFPASCFLSRHPVWIALLCFCFFWLYRSQTFVGDGDQLSRLIDSHYWMVQTELLSQAILQTSYQLLRPLGWDALSVINLISCLSASVAIWIVLLFNRDFVGGHGLWALGLYCSSGFLILSFGHTEYYTIFVASLFYYAYAAIRYLNNRASMLHATLAYSLSMWMHLGALFALPSLLLLPVLKHNWNDYKGLALGAIPIGAAFFLKEFSDVFHLRIHGLSPESNYVPFWFQPIEDSYYYMLSWGHLTDIVYAWALRSWIFWPIILIGLWQCGVKSIWRNGRLFLLVFSACFLIFTWIWHPNLGIESDWDLFSIEAVPSMLLALSYLPALHRKPAFRYLFALPLIASALIAFHFVLDRAELHQREYGSLKIVPSMEIETHVTLNGHHKHLLEPHIREGIYAGKVIDKTHGVSHNFYFHIAPNKKTTIPLQIPKTPPPNE